MTKQCVKHCTACEKQLVPWIDAFNKADVSRAHPNGVTARPDALNAVVVADNNDTKCLLTLTHNDVITASGTGATITPKAAP